MSSVLDFFQLYVFELQENKWFLHFASPANDDYLWLECASMFSFVRRFPPKNTFEILQINNVLEIDYFVKKYMLCYGVENVRGGSYSEETLGIETTRFLENEIGANLNTYFYRQNRIDEIGKRYRFINTISDKERESRALNNELLEYRALRQKITDLSCHNKINRELTDNIEWMFLFIANSIDEFPEKISKELSEKYNKTLGILKLLPDVFTNVLEKEHTYDTIGNLYNPEFVFDTFFYHSQNRDKCISELESADKLLRYFEYMTYFIINRVDEFVFDLSTFGEQYEETLIFSLEYIENVVI
jgi:hypothetical protein